MKKREREREREREKERESEEVRECVADAQDAIDDASAQKMPSMTRFSRNTIDIRRENI